jgi:tetratricopeptide (TPR) repeat protein
MPRSRWLAAVLLLSLAVRPAAAQAPLAWRWQEKDQFYFEWTAHIKTAHKGTRETAWPAPVEEMTRVVFRVTVLKRQPDGGVELELVLESAEADTLPGRLNPKVMEGLPVRAGLGPQMQVLRVDGLEAIVERRFGKGALPPQAKTFRALIEDVWREWLQSAFVPMPGAAAAGAKWEQETEKALPPLGRHVLRKAFVHEGKAADGGRELARVTVTAASSLVPYREGELDAPHKIAGAHFQKADYGGNFLFDPAAGRLVQGLVQLHTHLSAVVTADGAGGQELEATQDQRIEVRISDLKPAGPAAAVAPPGTADAPYRRLLTGEDARRAAEWEKRIADLTEAGLWGEALTLARQLVELRTRLQGAAHWQAADAARNVQTLERLLALSRADRAEFLSLPRLLAQAAELRARGKHAEGQALDDKAWAVRCRILGEEHHSTPGLYDELAAALSAQGKYAEALQLAGKALGICRRVLGEEHPDTARAYFNVGSGLLAQGNAREAEPLLRQALAIRLRVLGEVADTVRAYDSLAVSLHHQDRFADAQPLHEKAHALARRVLGEDAADTVQCGYNLAVNLLMLKRPAEAEPLLRRTLDVYLRSVGEQQLATALT